MTQAANTPPNGERPTAQHIADELKKLSDEVLWKNHRASDEVKDAVKLVAAELARTAEALKRSAPGLAALRDEAAVQGHLAVLEARDKLMLLDDVVRNALQGATSSPTFIGETARMKLALARMDAADLFEEKRRLMLEERRRIQQLNVTALRDLEDRLADLTRPAAQSPSHPSHPSHKGTETTR
jgi:hypothetical protein